MTVAVLWGTTGDIDPEFMKEKMQQKRDRAKTESVRASMMKKERRGSWSGKGSMAEPSPGSEPAFNPAPASTVTTMTPAAALSELEISTTIIPEAEEA